eukprot:3209751-Pyramimonas_sp.AAC.1
MAPCLSPSLRTRAAVIRRVWPCVDKATLSARAAAHWARAGFARAASAVGRVLLDVWSSDLQPWPSRGR